MKVGVFFTSSQYLISKQMKIRYLGSLEQRNAVEGRLNAK